MGRFGKVHAVVRCVEVVSGGRLSGRGPEARLADAVAKNEAAL